MLSAYRSIISIHDYRLKEEIDNALETRLAAYGVMVDDASLVDFTFSPEFSKAIEAKQIVEQEAKQAEFTDRRGESR